MPGKHWTPEEDAILREVWTQRGTLKMHSKRLPGRNNNAMRHRGIELGLPTRFPLATDRASWVDGAIEAELRKGFTGTSNELAELIGACDSQVRKDIKKGLGKKYRICKWVKAKNRDNWVAVYELGTEENAPRPKAKSGAQSSRDARARKKLKSGKFNPFAGLISQPPTVEKNSNERGRRGAYTVRRYSLEA